MVKKVLLFIMVLVSMSTSAEDFTAVIDGETFTFRVLSSSGVLTCELTGVENENITSVTLPLSVKYNMKKYNIVGIGDYAFNGVKLKTFKCEYPQYIEYFGYGAFINCESLQSLDFSEFTSLKEIGESAFCRCKGLTSIKFPNSVTSIGKFLFSGSTNLTSIIVEKGNPTYDSRDNCNAIIETASNTLIAGWKNTVIPNSVTSIGSYAFYECKGLTSIEIPNSVTSIEVGAFFGCRGLTSIKFPNSVTSIGFDAFDGCSSLTSIEIPNSVTSIGDCAFEGCSSLASIIVEEGNPTYDSRNNCNAIIVTASNKLIAGCKNTVIPNSVTSIGDYAFERCSSLMISIEIPKSVTSIGYQAFYGCSSLISIEIPKSVTSIGDFAFYGCSSLISIEIPKSVTSIGNYVFSQCESLKLLYVSHEIPLAIDKEVFKQDHYIDGCFDFDNCILFVPYGSIDLYKKAEVWSQFKNISGFSSSSSNDEDVNNDGKVNATDVMQIYNYILSH